jgi:hypothetical protein
MNFGLTDERTMIVEATRDFVEHELYPHGMKTTAVLKGDEFAITGTNYLGGGYASVRSVHLLRRHGVSGFGRQEPPCTRDTGANCRICA